MDPSPPMPPDGPDDVHWWFAGRRRIVAAALRRHLPPSDDRRIFDAACGTGEMVDVLAEFGTVSGIDASEDAVEACRRRFGDGGRFRMGTFPADLPASDAADVVAAFGVLTSAADDRAALRAVHGVLPSGGVLVTGDPAFEFLWGPLDEAGEHRRRYGRDDLGHKLEDAGFAVELLSYYDTLLFPAVAASRIVGRFRGWTEPRAEVRVPGPVANRLLAGVLAAEAPVVSRWSAPFGTSLLAIARKP